MRIIFLNTWHGKVWDKFREFIFDQTEVTDVFCFTEVDIALQEKLIELLPDFQPFYDEIIRTNYLDGAIDGQGIYVKEGIEVENYGKQMIYKITENDAGILQAMKIKKDGKDIFIGSVHGMAQPGDKLDNPIRLSQSQKIINFFKNKKGSRIIGGDFNLMPDTKSVKMFEEAGYKNLIKEFGIEITRNRFSWEQAEMQTKEMGLPFYEKQLFADYCFVSPDVKVKNFAVPSIEISDHLPLILDFEV